MAKDHEAASKSSDVTTNSNLSDNNVVKNEKGLGVGMTSFFIVAQMAGAGFLALPRAMADAGWIGIVMIIGFGLSVAFIAVRLGRSWTTLEKRHEEYRQPVRQPYMEIAYRSLGLIGRRLALFCMMCTLIGSGIVFLNLIAEMVNDILPEVSQCAYVIIFGVILIPVTWAGSPKDFWQASVFALVSTVICIIIIVIKIFLDFGGRNYPVPEYPNPSVSSFALGFGAIIFAFGGASVFPTIQNDMKDTSKFGKSLIIGFAVILVLYLPVALSAYILIGDAVASNILLSLKSSGVVIAAIILEIFNLLGTYVISLNPVSQALEDVMNVPHKFGIQRIALRTGIVIFQMAVALAIPDFSVIMNLIGGSTTTCLSFIFPPLMYIKLYDNKEYKKYMPWSLPLWERIFLWEIIFIGTVGGITSTLSALAVILSPDSFSKSCFLGFQ